MGNYCGSAFSGSLDGILDTWMQWMYRFLDCAKSDLTFLDNASGVVQVPVI